MLSAQAMMLTCFLRSTASREVMNMQTIEERLDHVRELLADSDFLSGKGLSNEVNIRIFPYDPKDHCRVVSSIEICTSCFWRSAMILAFWMLYRIWKRRMAARICCNRSMRLSATQSLSIKLIIRIMRREMSYCFIGRWD